MNFFVSRPGNKLMINKQANLKFRRGEKGRVETDLMSCHSGSGLMKIKKDQHLLNKKM
jgi:hypothetical protein